MRLVVWLARLYSGSVELRAGSDWHPPESCWPAAAAVGCVRNALVSCRAQPVSSAPLTHSLTHSLTPEPPPLRRVALRSQV